MRILFLILFSHFVFGQHAPLPMVSTSMNNWISQCGTRPSPKTIYALNNFVSFSISNGNFALLDRLWLFAQDLEANAKISVKNPTTTSVTAVNSPRWTAYLGYRSNGTTSYEETNYNPTTDNINYTQNDASIGTYINVDTTETSVVIGSGTASPARYISLNARYPVDGKAYMAINQIGTFQTVTVANSLGFLTMRRTSSSATAYNVNGVEILSNSVTSTAAPVNTISINARHTDAAYGFFARKRVALAYIGAATIDDLQFYNNINILATSLGFHF